MQVLDLAGWLVAVALLVSALTLSLVLPLVQGTSLGDAALTPPFWPGLAVLFVWLGLQWYKDSSPRQIHDLEKRKGVGDRQRADLYSRNE